jgi:hypothetical protein
MTGLRMSNLMCIGKRGVSGLWETHWVGSTLFARRSASITHDQSNCYLFGLGGLLSVPRARHATGLSSLASSNSVRTPGRPWILGLGVSAEGLEASLPFTIYEFPKAVAALLYDAASMLLWLPTTYCSPGSTLVW